MRSFEELPYRPCVGIMLLNKDGLVFVGHRREKRNKDNIAPGYQWQMPQGGIDGGESPYDAAIRELHEETNATTVSLLAEAPSWLSYDLPRGFVRKTWTGRYRGQRQKWFALRFEGQDSEIDIGAPAGHKPEFDDWRWERMDKLPDLIVPFKRPVYEQVIEFFADFAGVPA